MVSIHIATHKHFWQINAFFEGEIYPKYSQAGNILPF